LKKFAAKPFLKKLAVKLFFEKVCEINKAILPEF